MVIYVSNRPTEEEIIPYVLDVLKHDGSLDMSHLCATVVHRMPENRKPYTSSVSKAVWLLIQRAEVEFVPSPGSLLRLREK